MPCVSRYRLDFIHVRNLMPTCSPSNLDPIKTRSFENMIMAFFQNSRPECNTESFYTTGTQRKIDSFSVDGFCSHCNTIFEAFGCFYHFSECQKVQPCFADEDIVKGQRKRNGRIKSILLARKKLLHH